MPTRTHDLQIESHFSVFGLFTIHNYTFQLILPHVTKDKYVMRPKINISLLHLSCLLKPPVAEQMQQKTMEIFASTPSLLFS